ncbi:MAG: Lrp/AsnC family transcriptional regulator, partial [Thermoplasmatales archaeon]
QKTKLDNKDMKILNLLANNGKISIVEISNRTGIPSQNVIQRKRKMEKLGIIAKYSIDIDYKKIGYIFCKTFIYLQNLTETRLEELYKYCASKPNIFALTTTLGSWDLELEFEVENFERMTEIMNDIKKKFIDIVKNYESVIITKQTIVRYLAE